MRNRTSTHAHRAGSRREAGARIQTPSKPLLSGFQNTLYEKEGFLVLSKHHPPWVLSGKMPTCHRVGSSCESRGGFVPCSSIERIFPDISLSHDADSPRIFVRRMQAIDYVLLNLTSEFRYPRAGAVAISPRKKVPGRISLLHRMVDRFSIPRGEFDGRDVVASERAHFS